MSSSSDRTLNGKWRVSEGSLSIERGDGSTFVPCARAIFAAEFRGKNEIDDAFLVNRPSVDVPWLRISKYPLDLRVELQPPQAGVSQPVLRIIARRGKTIVNMPTFSRPVQDHVLVKDEWYPLDGGQIEEILSLLSDARISGAGELSLRQYLNLARLSSDVVSIRRGGVEAETRSRGGDKPDERMPGLFTGQLYPYQINGYRWLRMIAREDLGCILADEMGLGKTIQLIAFLAEEKENGRSPSLVIAPTTLLENWRREVTRFSSLQCHVHRGSERTGFPSRLKEHDLIITSYETALRDLPVLKMISWDAVILDEAQAIKNPCAQRTMAVKEISRRVSVAVTGTPLENHLTDLWSIMDFSVAGLLGELHEFERHYADSVSGAAAMEPVVSPVMLRRKMEDVGGDLPEKVMIPQPLELDDASAEKYERLRSEAVPKNGKNASLASLVRLRMFCTHPYLVETVAMTGDPSLCSTKYVRLLEILDEFIAKSEKTLIFTSFTKMIDILVGDLTRRYRIYCDFLDGRVAVGDRQKRIDDFSSYQGPAVLVLNPRAGGTGLNLFAANHVVHYNTEWNPAVEEQASARAYRLGQVRPVTIHRLFHASTVEDIMNTRMESKRILSRHAVVGHDGMADDLDDIRRAMQISPVLKGGQVV